MGRAAALAFLLLCGCDRQPAPIQAEPERPIEEPIPRIEGHDAHNWLATVQLGYRDLTLSRVIRSVGEDCMVVDRSMYQGYAEIGELRSSLWSAHCTTGTEWMVSVYPDGSGSVLRCGELPSTKCWERFKD